MCKRALQSRREARERAYWHLPASSTSANLLYQTCLPPSFALFTLHYARFSSAVHSLLLLLSFLCCSAVRDITTCTVVTGLRSLNSSGKWITQTPIPPPPPMLPPQPRHRCGRQLQKVPMPRHTWTGSLLCLEQIRSRPRSARDLRQ